MNELRSELPRYTVIPDKIFTDYQLTPYALTTFVVISAETQSGKDFPSVARISKLTGVTEPQVKVSLDELRNNGLISNDDPSSKGEQS